MHADLYLQDLTAALAAKEPPITQPGIPVAPVYAGIVSNAMDSQITGQLTVSGNNAGVTLAVAGSMAPLSLTLFGGLWTVTVPKGAPSAVYQCHIDATQLSNLVGRFVFSVVVLDLDPAKDTNSLTPPPNTQGALTFLQVQSNDNVHL